MSSLERIGSELGMVERLDLEGLGDMTSIARALRLAEAELPSVNVAMTACALARRTRIGRTMTAQPILFRRSVTAVACGLGMRARERPCAVVDAWGVPPALGVAVRATTGTHLRRKLIAVRVVVTVGASRGGELQARAGALASMAARARHGLMSPAERESRSSVLLYGEGRGPEAMLVVTARAVGLA
jgi:hypothetical protein